MSDMASVIVPKSDQRNADDLIAGPMTIKISKIDIRAGQEQPVSIFYDGDEGKPYKPCKSMLRVLVHAWGSDHRKYIGRSLTLYRDPSVKWGGLEVGGIRISHMSHIDGPQTFVLTATKGSRKPHKVLPLDMQVTEKSPELQATLLLIAEMNSKETVSAAAEAGRALVDEGERKVASAAYAAKYAELKGSK